MSTRTHGLVLGYDGSPESDEAARWAAGTAVLRGESLLALVVVEPMDSPRTQGWPESRWSDIEQRAADTLAAAGATDDVSTAGKGSISVLGLAVDVVEDVVDLLA